MNAALRLAADVILIGVVYVPQHESLSTGAYQARQVRRLLRELSAGPQVRYKAEVQVSHTPWHDLVQVIAEDEPDLLLLEWKCQLDALHVTAAEVLTRPPCDVALVRGPIESGIQAGAVAGARRPARRTDAARGAQHARRRHYGAAPHAPTDGESDVPFRGLAQILKSLPEVKTRSAVTDRSGADDHRTGQAVRSHRDGRDRAAHAQHSLVRRRWPIGCCRKRARP